MHQWDVFDNPGSQLREALPYGVLLQSDLLSHLKTRRIAPLARLPLGADQRTAARVMPVLHVKGGACLPSPQEAAPILARALGKPVASLRGDSHRIVDALDAVIAGV